jgi:hypothetical protein
VHIPGPFPAGVEPFHQLDRVGGRGLGFGHPLAHLLGHLLQDPLQQLAQLTFC